MSNPNENPNGLGPALAPRAAHAGGSHVPPIKQRSLQPAPDAVKNGRAGVLRSLRLLNAARRRAAVAVVRAIPPAPDPLSP